MNLYHNQNLLRPLLTRFTLLIILFIVMLPITTSGQDYFQWREEPSQLLFQDYGYDKIAFRMLTTSFITRKMDESLSWWQSDLFTFVATAIWEIKDGYIPEEKAGWWGGPGFNTNDLLANTLGIITTRASVLLWNRFRYGHWQFKNR
ncbi:MAG: hypothetical protein KAW56_08030 [Candidatus Marinimicrobia bacterium]|nr:hypothetical protein [Candidatus Neomarinimicrobiota bacterium]MCK4447015.1 hypothetical protein [Candidatus Neomarinimicrobiota bacterium]